MDPATQLLVAILILHAIEGFFLIPRQDWLFIGSTIRCQLHRPEGPLGNAHSAIVLMSPLSLLSVAFVGRLSPLGLTEQLNVVLGFIQNSIPQRRSIPTTYVLTEEDLNKISKEGKRIWLADGKFWELGSDIEVSHLKKQLSEIEQCDKKQIITWFQQTTDNMFDTDAIEERLRKFRLETQIVSLTSIISFISMLFWVSAIFFTDWGYFYLTPLSIFVLSFWFLSLFLTWLAHKKLYSEHKIDRWKKLGLLLLSPAGIARAPAILGRDLLVNYHPIAVASVLLSESDFKQFASETIRDWQYPLDGVTHLHPKLKQHWQKHYENLLQKKRLSWNELLQEGIVQEQAAKSYCPRCKANYSIETGFCADCRTISLVTFPSQS